MVPSRPGLHAIWNGPSWLVMSQFLRSSIEHAILLTRCRYENLIPLPTETYVDSFMQSDRLMTWAYNVKVSLLEHSLEYLAHIL